MISDGIEFARVLSIFAVAFLWFHSFALDFVAVSDISTQLNQVYRVSLGLLPGFRQTEQNSTRFGPVFQILIFKKIVYRFFLSK